MIRKRKIPRPLAALFKQYDSCRRCRERGNYLRHILGGGKFSKPRFLLLFINPTRLNLSSHPEYKGKRRYPFIGVRYFYRLLARAGFVDQKLIEEVYRRGWQVKDEEKFEDSLTKRSVYLTNLVKCTRPDSQMPSMTAIREDLPLLKKEISLVSPVYIIACGKLPFQILTGREIRLKDYLNKTRRLTPFLSTPILGKRYSVFPCYFPVGRGNPNKALLVLSRIRKYYAGD